MRCFPIDCRILPVDHFDSEFHGQLRDENISASDGYQKKTFFWALLVVFPKAAISYFVRLQRWILLGLSIHNMVLTDNAKERNVVLVLMNGILDLENDVL